ncbi:MAG: hypothetical protein HLUCCA12_07130 [Rhodobacteraceae bacterium HLUCCA12]|nr:MAG: hypothetical protein HLUCCA12_07130 [Rhodobacteraceae bacterium HLUCCA12]
MADPVLLTHGSKTGTADVVASAHVCAEKRKPGFLGRAGDAA